MSQWRAVLIIDTTDVDTTTDDIANAMNAAVTMLRGWAVADWWVDLDELEAMSDD